MNMEEKRLILAAGNFLSNFRVLRRNMKPFEQKRGLFDVSHMGEVDVKGPGSLSFLQKMLTNDISKLQMGGAQYTAMCYENGGRLMILSFIKGRKMTICSLSMQRISEKDFDWLQATS